MTSDSFELPSVCLVVRGISGITTCGVLVLAEITCATGLLLTRFESLAADSTFLFCLFIISSRMRVVIMSSGEKDSLSFSLVIPHTL